MDGEEKGRRNIVIIIVLLGLFDVIAIVLLAFFPNALDLPRGASEPIEHAAQDTDADDGAQGDDTAADAEGAQDAAPGEETASASDGTSDRISDTTGDATTTPESGEDSDIGATEEDAATAMPEDLSEIDPIPAASRELLREYQVMRTDTFFELTGEVWEDVHLWPDLYVLNSQQYPDPDFIEEGSTIQIYEQLGSNGKLDARELATLLDAYVRTYATYRELGEHSLARGRETGSRWHIQLGRVRINKAHWLLYSGLRFDRDFIEDFSDRIQDRDERVVRHFIDRFGYPER
jgi:hypothetical protein